MGKFSKFWQPEHEPLKPQLEITWEERDKWNAHLKEKGMDCVVAPPRDARFMQSNVTKWCHSYYVDYHRCHILKGSDYEPCEYFKEVYSAVCPPRWIEKWDELMAESRFPFDWHKQTS